MISTELSDKNDRTLLIITAISNTLVWVLFFVYDPFTTKPPSIYVTIPANCTSVLSKGGMFGSTYKCDGIVRAKWVKK